MRVVSEVAFFCTMSYQTTSYDQYIYQLPTLPTLTTLVTARLLTALHLDYDFK